MFAQNSISLSFEISQINWPTDSDISWKGFLCILIFLFGVFRIPIVKIRNRSLSWNFVRLWKRNRSFERVNFLFLQKSALARSLGLRVGECVNWVRLTGPFRLPFALFWFASLSLFLFFIVCSSSFLSTSLCKVIGWEALAEELQGTSSRSGDCSGKTYEKFRRTNQKFWELTNSICSLGRIVGENVPKFISRLTRDHCCQSFDVRIVTLKIFSYPLSIIWWLARI